ncbi:hypothetical protein M413DRAFT_167637 [Hebeloma cylindrosporum]|uniref:Uncharacterized protein n=1 Tax=Hebeloma cylindrosporum TaxID=76867 RepID=A0A0C3BVY0_HEBCY|nr:hypothetical protein M413DRAFT_167637 [Hebeloma cylindrosporum h7]
MPTLQDAPITSERIDLVPARIMVILLVVPRLWPFRLRLLQLFLSQTFQFPILRIPRRIRTIPKSYLCLLPRQRQFGPRHPGGIRM